MADMVPIRFDPRCEEARRLRALHEKDTALAKDLPGTRLWAVLSQRRDKAYAEHDRECPKCWAYARRCLDCGADLTALPHRFSCRHNARRWRGIFRTREPPLAAEAMKRPWRKAPLETPPPRRVPLEAVRPKPAPRAPAAAPPPPPPPKPKPKPSPHEVLGLPPGATVSAIRAAYREKAMEYHPDRVAALGPDLRRIAEQKMREINDAYEALLRMVASAK